MSDLEPPQFTRTVRIVGYIMAGFVEFFLWIIVATLTYAGVTTFWDLGGHFYAFSLWFNILLLCLAGLIFFFFLRFSFQLWKQQVFKWQNWYWKLKQEAVYTDVLDELHRRHAREVKQLNDTIQKLLTDNKRLLQHNRLLLKGLYFNYSPPPPQPEP